MCWHPDLSTPLLLKHLCLSQLMALCQSLNLKMINGGLIANLTALSLAPRWGRQCRSMMHRPGIYHIPMKP